MGSDADYDDLRARSQVNWPGACYHVGWPPRDVHQILDRVKRGLPVYWPTDPKPCDQRKYIEWAEKRGPNSE